MDTNILIYAATARLENPVKYHRADQIVSTEPLCLSVQVLQEFFVNVIWKPAFPLTRAEAVEWVRRLARYPCAETDTRLVNRAIALSDRYVIHYWDAAILAAAERLGAEVVYTEDLNHGQVYGTVRVENPFATA